MTLRDRIRSWFAWRTVRDSGVWLYEENTVTGARRVSRIGGGHQPQDLTWLSGGT